MKADKWQLSELPVLEGGDIFFSRSEGFPGSLVRWFFRDQAGCQAPFNHAGLISEPVYDQQGDLYAVEIVESIWKGPAPGELWTSYHDKHIAILRPCCSEYLRRRALVLAYARGTVPYDYTIVLTIIRRKGLRWTCIVVDDLLHGRQIAIPHIQDGRLVCIEEVQEPYSTAGFPLYPDPWLMPPIPTELTDTCEIIFDSMEHKTELV